MITVEGRKSPEMKNVGTVMSQGPTLPHSAASHKPIKKQFLITKIIFQNN